MGVNDIVLNVVLVIVSTLVEDVIDTIDNDREVESEGEVEGEGEGGQLEMSISSKYVNNNSIITEEVCNYDINLPNI